MQILPAKPIIILQLVHVLRTLCRSMYLLLATNHNNHPKRIEVVVCDDCVIYRAIIEYRSQDCLLMVQDRYLQILYYSALYLLQYENLQSLIEVQYILFSYS